ncbi:hypothetical protein M3Y99_00208800 [Aphelenchoides fujianensis]|nr:hypothetical protein M3Y99_00208800 [Aphelenchoides fujianensis]
MTSRPVRRGTRWTRAVRSGGRRCGERGRRTREAGGRPAIAEMDSSGSFEDDTEFSEAPPLLEPQVSAIGVPEPRREPQQTIVIYQLDHETTPYRTTVDVPPSRFTLAHLKRALNRRNFKGFIKHYDETLRTEVNVHISDDHQILKPNRQDRFLLHLETIVPEEQFDREFRPGTLRATGRRRRARRPPEGRRSPVRRPQAQRANLRESRGSPPVASKPPEAAVRGLSHFAGRHLRWGLATARGITPTPKSPKASPPSPKCRTRHAHRHVRSLSLTSSTCDDTDVSMAVNTFTVPIPVDPHNPDPGLSVTSVKRGDRELLYVGEITPGSAIARDGRIRRGHLILAVNGDYLDRYPGRQAVALLQQAFYNAARTRGFVELTCCDGPPMPTTFQLPDESVRPLDMEVWRDDVNQRRAINELDTGTTALLGGRPCSSSGVESLPSSQLPVRFPLDAPMELVHTSLNVTISDSFGGQDLINWLADHVIGLNDKKSCEKYANELLRRKFIIPVMPKNHFAAVSYYTINQAKIAANTMRRGVCTPLDLNAPAMDDTLVGHKCTKACAIKRLFCMHQASGKRHK